ncbi:restriction endonuclease subunit S [Metamycoplasma hominis]|uniref:restriction endonuclease subunit S n=1 Tax=Metamycoplasma hominis TaxID=2098 RepID=UPI000696585C|nr:restriction endonuclease subunit S [Metamycoplasma hominis]
MKLKDIVKICYGKNQKLVEVEHSDIPILGTGGIIGYSSKPLYEQESVLIGRKGTIAMPFYINKPFWAIDTLFYTQINTNIAIPKFLYYLLCTIGLKRYSEGAAVPSLTVKTLNDIELNIPSLKTQQHIVNTIGSIDDLIENKQKIINKLIKQSTNIFRKYCNQKIIKNINLGKYCKIKTGNLNADSAVENGKYLFFTCGQKDLYINNYAFDCKAIIISGNGEISCKYYEGKFNAYQRTYVLEPERYFYLFLKQCELSVNNLKNNSRGSVIRFITKGILESISIPICQNSNVINNKLSIIYNLISKTKNEIIKLKYIKQKILNKYF